MRIAVIDIGTNTVLLLITNIDDREIRVIADNPGFARLGEGVDRTRRISEEAFNRFIAILTTHAATIASNAVHHTIAFATSALRDAENREEIIQRTKSIAGIDIELLTGDDEARWTYRGALLGISPKAAEGAVGVVDIGGGSTEISFGDGNRFDTGTSIDIGAVRITERWFATNPITKEAAEAARATIRSSIQSSTQRPRLVGELVAVAGTPTSLAAMHQGLPKFERDKIHGYVLHAEAIDRLLDILLTTDTRTILDRFPSLNKARADILPAGTLILREAMDYCGVNSVRVSTRGVRYGIAIREGVREFGEGNFIIVE